MSETFQKNRQIFHDDHRALYNTIDATSIVYNMRTMPRCVSANGRPAAIFSRQRLCQRRLLYC